MNRDRQTYLLERIASHAEEPTTTVGIALCATAVEVLDIEGAGISIHGGDGAPYSLAVVGADMALIHELERNLNEGPCVDAYRLGIPTNEPDLHTSSSWPAFGPEAQRTTARAVFGYPVRIASSCVGALNLYATRTGPLGDERHHDALILAELTSHAVVASLLVGGDVPQSIDVGGAVRTHDHLHQATGMLSVQLSIPIVDALARLRAHAYAAGRDVLDVAKDVVEGRLRLTD